MRSREGAWIPRKAGRGEVGRGCKACVCGGVVAAGGGERAGGDCAVCDGGAVGEVRGALPTLSSPSQFPILGLPHLTLSRQGGNVFADDPLFAFHNDTSAETAASWAPYTTHSDLAALSTPLEYAAWRHIPSTYVVCELDRCILPHVQEGMIKATGGKVKVRRLRSGHMPMLSVPEALVDVLRGVGGWVGCVGG